MTEEIRSSECNVVLELHLLTKLKNDKFSVPYRILQFDCEEFKSKILNNNCILPKQMFSTRCKQDLLPEQFYVQDNNGSKSKFSKLFVKTYIELNSFFNHLYRNVNYRPHKMFMVAFHSFVYGLQIPSYVVSELYDLVYGTVVSTANVKEPFYLMTYLIRQYQEKSFKELDCIITDFGNQVRSFNEHSVKTYNELNGMSKLYTQEDMGGTVCSYALTKSFKSVTPNDIIYQSNESYRRMTDTFKQLIEYYETKKYEEINSEIRRGMTVQVRAVTDLTRYILKRYVEPLFGLNIKKADLKQRLSCAMIKFYGTFPPPHIDLKATSILCEMMAGAYDSECKFASVEILNLKPFKPVLVKWKDKEFRVITLNGLNLDNPIPNRVLQLVQKHIEKPSIESYMDYCFELIEHINRSDYFYHETVNPFLPVYTLNIDVDIYDHQYIKNYYEGELQWEVKETLFENLKNLVLYVTKDVMELPVSKENTVFYIYESARTDLDKINSKKFKLGVRLIVKFTTVCFKNRAVVNDFLNVLNMYRIKFDHLNQISDDNIFDTGIYGQNTHNIRLPLNLKSDGTKPLVPIFFPCHKSSFQQALYMITSLVHYRNLISEGERIYFIEHIPIPTEEILGEIGERNIYKSIYCIKSKETEVNEKYHNLKSFKFSDKQTQVLINAIDRFSMGRLRKYSNRKFLQIFQNHPLQYHGRNKFSWCSGLKFCAITEHKNASGNPCNYYVKLSSRFHSKFNKRECYVFCHCYSTTCQALTRKNCIAKCLL